MTAAHGDRGAVVVEFALILPILAMLIFGMISAGMAWNNNLALSHAAQVGGRYAATLKTSGYTTLDDYLDAVSTRTVDGGEGSLTSSTAGRVVCVAYVYPAGTADLDKTRRRYEDSTGVTRANSTCFTDSEASTERRVQVMVERSAKMETGLWSTTVTLHQQAVYQYEIDDGL